MRVLVVEDDETTARIIERVLQDREGWEVVRVRSAEEAEERILEEEPLDAVVLDHVLPDGTGLEVLHRISKEDGMLPVVFLTGEGDEDVAYQALSHGAMDYMVKGDGGVPGELPDRVELAVDRWSHLGPLDVVESEEDGSKEEGSTEEPSGSRKKRGRKRVPALQQDYDDLEALLEAVDDEEAVGCAVYDGQGTTMEANLPEGTNRRGLGRLAVDVSRHVSAMALAAGQTPRRHFLTVETREGLVGSSIVPGPLIFVMLFPEGVSHEEALHRLKRTARKVWGASG